MSNKDAISKTIRLYQEAGWKKWFSKWRFRMAPYIEVEKLLPKKGKIVELGCGEGIFSNYLALSSRTRQVIGYEINEERIKEANRGLPNAIFKKADVTKLSIPNADAVVIFHVLHHLTSYGKQKELLTEILVRLKKGKKLMIVEVNVKPSWKFVTAWLFDHFIVPIVFEHRMYDSIFFRKRNEWVKLLEELGFSVHVREAEKGMVFPHVILNCTKTRST